ncbi:MAG: hypothetical protein FWD66_03610, partial [Paludibacter sp.]|nr:hypothetical protein [Paludibacter sp.]
MVYKNMNIDNMLKPQQQEVSKGSYGFFGCNSLIINMLPPPQQNTDNQVITGLSSINTNIQQGIYKNTFSAFCVSYLLRHCDGVSPKQSGKRNIVSLDINKELYSGLLRHLQRLAMTINKVNIRHCERSEAIQRNTNPQRQCLGNIKRQIKIVEKNEKYAVRQKILVEERFNQKKCAVGTEYMEKRDYILY